MVEDVTAVHVVSVGVFFGLEDLALRLRGYETPRERWWP